MSKDNSSNNQDFVIRDGFPALRLPNGDGPWIDGDEPLPQTPIAIRSNALEFDRLDSLLEDCRIVFSARAKEDAKAEAYSAGVTYFCPAVLRPRCALEALALSIFRQHTQHLEKGVMIENQSGAEWWTLVLDDHDDKETAGPKEDDDSDDEDDGDEVGLHFDADYGLEDQAPNLLLHPRVATVTYLSNCGAPTVVFEKRSPPPYDVEKEELNGDLQRAWLSHPRVGKHLAFDGRFLHGAPATFFPPHSTKRNPAAPEAKRQKLEQRQRVTLLVNVWVNHCPLDAEPLDDAVRQQLKTPFQVDQAKDGSTVQQAFKWNSSDWTKPPICDAKTTLAPSSDDPAGDEEFLLCSRLVTAKYGASMKDLHEASLKGNVVELQFGTGALSLEVGGLVPSEEDEARSTYDKEKVS